MCDDREIHGLAPGFIPSKVLTAGTWKDSKICLCDLICTWVMYLMSLSHSHRVSTGLAASQEMLLRATCLQIKGALGFPKRIVLFVVLFYVQPCCRTFHTSSFWGLGLPNGVQSLQAKTPAGWKLKFGSDSDDEAISDVPMRIWISKFVSSEVGNRSPSKDGSRRAPQLLLEMECSFGWSRLRCAGVKASNVPRIVGGSWFLSCKVLHVKVVMGAPEKNLRALRLPGSGPSEFNGFSLKGSQTAGIG